ncbi:MAG: hypothetical protein U0325_34525 [Polyangiales bacterium]
MEVCLTCGATAGARPGACEHARVGKVELTPRNARMLSQLRGAWSYARYMAERFEQTVEVEALAGRAVVAPSDRPAEPSKPERAARTEAAATRQIPLFGD